jgi:hypothetical protein
MKDITETHPSLSIKKHQHLGDETPFYTKWTMERLLEDIQKHTIDKAVLKEKINKFLERIDKKVIHYPLWREPCPTCRHSINDYNNRDKLFSKTVLRELLKELGLNEVEK